MKYLFLSILAVVCLSSCTDEQITRAHGIVTESDAQLARANDAVKTAQDALTTAKAVASQINNEEANKVIAQAQSALDQVKSAQAIIVTTNGAAHSALDAATQSQAAGGSTFSVVSAAATGAVPGILAAALAAMKWFQAFRSFKQTVTGLDAAKAALAADPATAKAWDDKVAPALDASQDVATKQHVALVQAKSVS